MESEGQQNENNKFSHFSRRQFLTGILLSCTAISLDCSSGLLLASQKQSAYGSYKFLREIDQKLTCKQWIQQRHSKYIGILNEVYLGINGK